MSKKKKYKTTGKFVRVCLYDEMPRLGCGVRNVEIISEGYKWVKVRYDGMNTRIKASIWNMIIKGSEKRFERSQEKT